MQCFLLTFSLSCTIQSSSFLASWPPPPPPAAAATAAAAATGVIFLCTLAQLVLLS